jgi:hypothetical protein|tara:strand:+ start:134 stop:424 length:291 start_codon:yes stop_codon:yes gene_type:complete
MFTIFNPRISNPDHMRRVVEATVQDKFFTVGFTKADGSFRKINGRLGVEKHKKGGRDCNTNKQMMTVWDNYAEGYRNVNLLTIKYIIADGVKLEFQ